ncbi:hypothetical protein B0I31_10839 [Saccharothrix carnea]|uniref:Sugar lactone lactonase YvrE n=1 Tax=Saccharothrix carnea TaxID=1280637 RepID=A0A2P8I561_SACCR|nr:hypothetical protein [Saccharothrix carnea]PSL53592.1 hypothetical protein B0I31_10839 [Saccharothrix carnea]
MFSRRVKPRAHAELVPAREDDVLVSAGVGPHGEVVALWSTAEGREALLAYDGGPGRPAFAATRAEHPVAARLTVRDAVVEVAGLTLAHCQVQPLPGDRFLVVGGRCRWRPEGAEHNAQVIDSAGDVVRTAVLGDGIGHLATTPTGQVWVGYFDEGVYGNFGWGGPGPDPVGGPGLVRFDRDLRRAWAFPGDGDAPSIDDCYALNVAGETAWASYYSDFPVVRVGDGDRVAVWANEVEGAGAVVTDGTRCALVGGYGRDHHLVRIGELTGEGRFEVRHTRRLVMPGPRSPSRWTMAGRGDVLHLISGTSHYRVDLDQLSAFGMSSAVP